MGHRFQYDQRYNTLLVVRKAASYTDAGNRLSLTPSAVAHQIHSIEQELDVQLFQKSGKKLIATPACDLIAKYVERIQMLGNRLCGELKTMQSQLRRLVVGITPSAESGALSKVLARYQSSFEGLQITVFTKSAAVLHDMLRHEVIDFAIAEGDFPTDELHSILLDTDRLVVALPSDSPYAAQGMITIDQLRRERLILRPRNSGTHALLESSLKKAGISLDEFNVTMEVDSVDTIKGLVAGGYGASVLSSNACAEDVAQGRIRTAALCNMNMIREIRLFYRDDLRDNAFIGEIQKIYAEVAHV